MENEAKIDPRTIVRNGDGAVDWDSSYAGIDQWWSGHVNGALAAEASNLTPGTALDVGCGEGGDAIWLARRGWQVTGLDISRVAVERARKAAMEAGVEIDWIVADLAAEPPATRFDLVNAAYPALLHAPGDPAIRALLGAVAPGGRLLIVGHDQSSDHARAHGFDPADYVLPPDVARHLGAGWTVEVDEIRPRIMPPGFDGPDVPDVVLLARRD